MLRVLEQALVLRNHLNYHRSSKFFLWCSGLDLARGHVATHKTVSLRIVKFVVRKKITDNLNFEPNRLLMLHPARPVTLSRGL